MAPMKQVLAHTHVPSKQAARSAQRRHPQRLARNHKWHSRHRSLRTKLLARDDAYFLHSRGNGWLYLFLNEIESVNKANPTHVHSQYTSTLDTPQVSGRQYEAMMSSTAGKAARAGASSLLSLLPCAVCSACKIIATC